MKALHYTFLFALLFIVNKTTIASENTSTFYASVKAEAPRTLPSSLSGFSYVYSNGPSSAQSISLPTNNLRTRSFVTITAPNGFEVSQNLNSGYSSGFTINGFEITTEDIVFYVRLKASLDVKEHTGNLDITAPSAPPNPAYNKVIFLEGFVQPEATSWNGTSWTNGLPSKNHSITISANYSAATNGNLNVYSLAVATGATLTVDNGSYAKIQEHVDVYGQLTVETQGAFVQVSDTASFTIKTGGAAQVNKTTSPLARWYDYTYWSSPVNGITAANAFAEASSSRRYWYNAQNFLDVLKEVGNTNTFVAGHDDIDDNGDDWAYLADNVVLTPGAGYATSQSSGGFSPGNTYDFSFEGPFNTGTITTPLYYNGDNGDKDWNLIGNPYPSAISADAFFAVNASKIGGAIYLWSHASVADANGSGNEVYNFSTDDYAIINAGSGEIAGGKNIIPNRYIPSGQGFFVQALATNNVTFTNSMRMADQTNNSQFFRGPETANKIWLNLTSDNGIFCQTLVAYVDEATNGNDGVAFDTERNLSSNVPAILYTTIPEFTDKKYAIQGKASASLNTNEQLALGFYTTITEPTIYKLSIAKLQGDFMDENAVYLVDNLLNITHNLKTSDYSFTSTTGTFNDRFVIVFDINTLSTNQLTNQTQEVSVVYNNPQSIDFKTNSHKRITQVTLFNLAGKPVHFLSGNAQKITFNHNNTLAKGVYLANIVLDADTVIVKKIII
ncbi:T9SS type A sorting domain-containing protein [Bizionia sediminis]|uniref:T9SS type A sorting domain-containing protein n=1 Tax=Bizionia sediminis TaxID=1737064 RepID=A0ABW5KSC3_9FLAO